MLNTMKGESRNINAYTEAGKKGIWSGLPKKLPQKGRRGG